MSISLATKGVIRDAPLMRTIERVEGMTTTLEVVDDVEGLVDDKIVLIGVIDKPDGDPC